MSALLEVLFPVLLLEVLHLADRTEQAVLALVEHSVTHQLVEHIPLLHQEPHHESVVDRAQLGHLLVLEEPGTNVVNQVVTVQ